MNTLRTLPLLRPSRSASPAPTTSDVQAQATPSMPPPVTASVSQGGRSRSVSRPLGGIQLLAGNGASTANTASAPSSKANSPPTSRPGVARTGSVVPMPVVGNGHTSGAPVSGGVEPQGGFIDAISLRLNEQVNKTCLGVDFKAKKGVKKGLGWSLGEAVVKELPAADSDAYLLRAVIRTAVRSLTIYVSRIEYLILPALTDAAFASPVNLSQSGPAATQLNPTQLFAVSLCQSAWETCEVLEIALESQRPPYPKFVNELLRPVMDKLDSVVARVITPVMANVKRELLAALDSTGHTPPGSAKALPLPGTATPSGSIVNAKALHTMPACLKAFASKVEGARKVFETVCKDCREDGESWITSVVVAVIWRGMVVCQTKYAMQGDLPSRDANGRPPSPESMAKALAALAVEPAVAKPAAGPVSAVGKMAAILPSRPVSRPASPPGTSGDFGKGPTLEPTGQYLATFENLVQRLVNGLVLPPVPNTTNPDATENLAREALGEAIEALQSQRTVVVALQSGPNFICEVLKNLRDDIAMPTEAEESILDAAEDVPAVLLFHLLARRVNIAIAKYLTAAKQSAAGGHAFLRSPYEVWGISRLEYDRQVMSGFGVAEERARRVAMAWKGELERVLPEVASLGSATGLPAQNHNEIVGWLKSLGLALEARTGVKAVLSL